MSNFLSLAGEWEVKLADCSKHKAILPGTLDTNNIGYEDKPAKKLYQDENYIENEALSASKVIATRFTRNHTYEGKAVFRRVCDQEMAGEKRYFLIAERARVLELSVDGVSVPSISGSLSTPYIFEVTGLLHKGAVIEITSDNSYEGLPHDNIVYSSAATDETQTNWNGIIGRFGLLIRERTFIESIRVYPKRSLEDGRWTLDTEVCIDSDKWFREKLELEFEELGRTGTLEIAGTAGKSYFKMSIGAEVPDDLLWDEYEGRLCHVRAVLIKNAGKDGSSDVLEEAFGIRSFEDIDGHLCLNGRRIFLRSEANCAVFPEEGHPPVSVDAWKEVIRTYMGYGVNCLRFHSHCPPEEAFMAADELGIMMQPELSHWNPADAFSDQTAAGYYRRELSEIIRTYANHPSFVMMTFGNELQYKEDGASIVKELLKLCHEMDKTRLFAFSSNAFYGEKGADPDSDFYTAMRYKGLPMRATFDGMQGYLNNEYPNACHNYDDTVAEIRKEYEGPVYSFEVGQFEVLPDFKEIDLFHGVTRPENLGLIKEKVAKKGLLDNWEKRVEATGELSLLGYREEVEAALRSRDYSGISLLGLQDFPGQGTALVGMLNSHLVPKPYSFAEPGRFRSFFTDVLPLVYLEKYTYVEDEVLRAKVRVANYSKGDIEGRLEVSVCKQKYVFYENKEDKPGICKQGSLSDVGEIEICLSKLGLKKNSAVDLHVSFAGFDNTYRIFVYMSSSQNPVKPANVHQTKVLDNEAGKVLENGGVVFLAPDSSKEEIPSSIKSTFTTDFWSVGTFASQEGSMGLLIEDKHPLFRDYPTDFHTDYQWFMQSSQRAMILPDGIKSIVTVMDSYAYLRNMGMLLEFNCLKGKVFISSMGLHDLMDYPECRALLSSIYEYISSEEFVPEQSIDFDELKKMICSKC